MKMNLNFLRGVRKILIPLIFLCNSGSVFATPNADISGSTTICNGTSANLMITFTGCSPDFTFIYSDGTNTYSSPVITTSTYNLIVSPSSTTTYTLVSFTSGGTFYNSSFVTGSGVVTVNPLPAAYTGPDQAICLGGNATLGTLSASVSTYSWATNDPSFTDITNPNPTVAPTASGAYFYTLTETNYCGSASNTANVTVNPLPAALVGSSQTICSGTIISIGGTVVSGDIYSWSSSPTDLSLSDITNSNPTATPTTTTIYNLTETISGTGCSFSNSVVITVNPLPAANAGSDQAICFGTGTEIGAASVGGDAYLWSSSPNDPGFTSTSLSDPVVSPTITTSYSLLEVNPTTTCSYSNFVVITVIPAPAAIVGGDQSICLNASTTVGASAVSGDTYTWSSTPSGFSSTESNPTVSPVVTTTYLLTETNPITACSFSNSVVINVNPLPAADAGAYQVICAGNAALIGAGGVTGDTYLWSSSPVDASFSNITNAYPGVSPSVSTTYTLTETIAATGCTNSNSVVVTANPLPAANTGSNQSICIGNTATIGTTAVAGNTYAWASLPSGFYTSLSVAVVAPTITTTYILTETITATGCSYSNNVVVTVNPLPAANAGSGNAICYGSSTVIGSSPVGSDTYLWASNPPGYYGTASSATVNPTSLTTYTLTETTPSGCVNSNSVIIAVNPLPGAIAGSNQSICFGTSTSIGASAVGTDTYTWTSNPSGFSSTSSNPAITPATTTTYMLTETILATGCTNSNSVIVTINPLPAANAGSDQSICTGNSAMLGSSAVSGDTYSWSSNPSGTTSTLSNPGVTPTVTTTYTLIETITATGCTNTNLVVVTVNPIPAANPGSNASICNGDTVSIGASPAGGHTYSWASSPSGFTSTSANPAVSPTATTTYALTETIMSTGCTNANSAIITVNPLPAADVGTPETTYPCSSLISVSIGAASVSGDTYSWVSYPSGFTSTSSNPTVTPSVTTAYLLTETITATGCSKTNTTNITVVPNNLHTSLRTHNVQKLTY